MHVPSAQAPARLCVPEDKAVNKGTSLAGTRDPTRPTPLGSLSPPLQMGKLRPEESRVSSEGQPLYSFLSKPHPPAPEYSRTLPALGLHPATALVHGAGGGDTQASAAAPVPSPARPHPLRKRSAESGGFKWPRPSLRATSEMSRSSQTGWRGRHPRGPSPPTPRARESWPREGSPRRVPRRPQPHPDRGWVRAGARAGAPGVLLTNKRLGPRQP